MAVPRIALPRRKRAVVLVACVLTAACGGHSSPAASAPAAAAPPSDTDTVSSHTPDASVEGDAILQFVVMASADDRPNKTRQFEYLNQNLCKCLSPSARTTRTTEASQVCGEFSFDQDIEHDGFEIDGKVKSSQQVTDADISSGPQNALQVTYEWTGFTPHPDVIVWVVDTDHGLKLLKLALASPGSGRTCDWQEVSSSSSSSSSSAGTGNHFAVGSSFSDTCQTFSGSRYGYNGVGYQIEATCPSYPDGTVFINDRKDGINKYPQIPARSTVRISGTVQEIDGGNLRLEAASVTPG